MLYHLGMRRIITALVGLSMVAGVGIASANPRGERGERGERHEVERHETVRHEVVRHEVVREHEHEHERVYAGRGYERGYGGYHFRDHGVRPDWRYNERFEVRSGYSWVGGDWAWDGVEWVWAPGHYVHLHVW